MTINGNTIVRVIDNQTYLGQDVKNVYHYILTSQEVAPNLAALSNEFVNQVLVNIGAVQSQDLVHNTVKIEMVNRGNLENEVTLNIPGGDAGQDESPSFLTASYKLVRSDTDTRNGRKSIAGLHEGDVDGNNLSTAGFTKFAGIIPNFLLNLTTVDGDWRPIILGKVSSPTSGTYFVNFLSSVVLRSTVGTQNSRKQ